MLFWLSQKICLSTAATQEDIQGCSCSCQWAGSHHLPWGGGGNWVWFYPLTLPWVSQLEEKRGWSAPDFCLSPSSIFAMATADPGRQMGSTEPQKNVKHKHAHGAARATWEAAVVEGHALIMSTSDEHRQNISGGIPAPHLCPQPPQSCWSSDPHLWAAVASLSFGRASSEPSSAGGSVLGTIPTAEGSFPPNGIKHLNLECRLNVAHMNMVETAGWWDVPPNLAQSMLQPLHKPCPLWQKHANCVNHALCKTSEINNPQAEVLLEVSWPQMF